MKYYVLAKNAMSRTLALILLTVSGLCVTTPVVFASDYAIEKDFRRAALSVEEGDFKKARIVYQQLILKHQSIAAYEKLAALELTSGRFEVAYNVAQQLLELQSANRTAIEICANYSHQNKQYIQAMDYFQQLIDANPDDPTGYVGKANVLSILGQETLAEEFREKQRSLMVNQ